MSAYRNFQKSSRESTVYESFLVSIVLNIYTLNSLFECFREKYPWYVKMLTLISSLTWGTCGLITTENDVIICLQS